MSLQAPYDKAVVISFSPRTGGNSDFAADLALQVMQEAGLDPRLLHLREHPVLPCKGCDACAASPAGRCSHIDRKTVESLFHILMEAPLIVFTSPIYFYHLPANAKAWVDRSQSLYMRWEAGDPELKALKKRDALACMVAGRKEGEKLFAGSLLTLRFFLKTFRVALPEVATFRGLDAADDFSKSESAQTEWKAAVEAYLKNSGIS
jgi:multimeric flavodoxin WrbA